MNKYSAGFGLSLIVTNLLNAVILVIKETNDYVMNAMKAALGHHWTTHVVILMVAFVVLGFIFSGMKLGTKWDSQKMMKYIIWAVIISVVIIAGFSLTHLNIAAAIKY
jgi:uncharacterized membrane protein